MTKLNLPSATIKRIVDDPTLLGVRRIGVMSNATNSLNSLGISPSDADHILDGYNSGFRAVFIMNATLAAVATVVSILMIRHKNLSRDDDAQLRAQAGKTAKQEDQTKVMDGEDIELGTLQGNDKEAVSAGEKRSPP
jgi:hypothetical protein